MVNRFLSILILGLILISACVPVKEKEYTEFILDRTDPMVQTILNFQDKGETDSLLIALEEANPAYRYLAAQAFGSTQDLKAIPALSQTLANKQEFSEVREAAAFALGQMQDQSALSGLMAGFQDTVEILDNKTLEVDALLNERILEAIGKVGDESVMKNLSSVSTYRPDKKHLLKGHALGLYQFALRDLTSEAGTKRMVQYLTSDNYPEDVKLIAVNYLMRSDNLNLDESKFQLAKVLTTNENPDIRMAAAIAVGKIKSNELLPTLLSQLELEDDYRVRINIIRALGNYPYIKVVEKILPLINDPNASIAMTAANYLYENGNGSDAVIYRKYITDEMPWQVRNALYKAVHKNLFPGFAKTRGIVLGKVLARYATTTNNFEKADLLHVIGEDYTQYKWIIKNALSDPELQIRTKAAEVLNDIMEAPALGKGSRARRIRKAIMKAYEPFFKSGDIGITTVGSSAITNTDLEMVDLLEDFTFLDTAAMNLKLPRDMEANIALQKAIKFVSGNSTEESNAINFNHPIDWKVLDDLLDSPEANIVTTKGTIKVSLFKEETPGTVSNFVSLSKDGFFNNKQFHRVVPNFVIQGGCPRGDGYGSLDYTIRSEFTPRHYDKGGFIGMASAGKDTECTQWFITHSPALHLDGKYTIFGEVVEGMEVVHQLQLGDMIKGITIKN